MNRPMSEMHSSGVLSYNTMEAVTNGHINATGKYIKDA